MKKKEKTIVEWKKKRLAVIMLRILEDTADEDELCEIQCLISDMRTRYVELQGTREVEFRSRRFWKDQRE